LPAVCTPGANQCSGGDVETCNECGQWALLGHARRVLAREAHARVRRQRPLVARRAASG
jgi:hypothetical protein